MGVLAVKVLLAPTFVIGASLAARRFGPVVGGLLAGLPVVAGPILLVYSLEHGRSFAANAATGTLLGLISLTAFVVVYGRVARRAPWPVSLFAGWLTFGLCTVLFSTLAVDVSIAVLLACTGFVIGLLLLPRAHGAWRPRPAPPAWDLPLRACCSVALVLALTAAAGWLGPQLSGLLAPFPIIASVLATFTQAQQGADEALRLLRGLLTGFFAFAFFCATLALALVPAGIAGAFALASLVACLTQAVLLTRALYASGALAPVGRAP